MAEREGKRKWASGVEAFASAATLLLQLLSFWIVFFAPPLFLIDCGRLGTKRMWTAEHYNTVYVCVREETM